MDSLQSSLLWGVVLLLGISVTVETTVRTAPVADIREVFAWTPDRYVRREIEEGILLPPYPSDVQTEDEEWSNSINVVQPKPKSILSQLFPKLIIHSVPTVDEEIISQEEVKEEDISQMSYVDSSQFRRSNSRDEVNPLDNMPFPKKLTGKYLGLDEVKATAAEKVANKHIEFGSSKKKNDSENKSSSTAEGKQLQQTTAVPTTTMKETDERIAPAEIPPVWSHSSLAEELSDPFGRLPSNEEYDRESRFAHSILYGYNTGF